MAKLNDQEKDKQVTGPAEQAAPLAKTASGGMQVVDPKNLEGFETMEMEDIKVPQLRLLQGQHPDILANLGTNGDFQDSVSKKVLGKEVTFIPLTLAGKMRFKWNEKEDGGWDCMSRDGKRGSKPRVINKNNENEYGTCATCRFTQFGTSTLKDKEHQPGCTVIPAYFVAVPGRPFFYALSFPKTKVKVYQDFTTALRIAAEEADAVPMRYKRFKVGTILESKHGNTWLNFKITPDGILKEAKERSEMDAKFAMILENFNRFIVDIEEEAPATAGAAQDTTKPTY